MEEVEKNARNMNIMFLGFIEEVQDFLKKEDITEEDRINMMERCYTYIHVIRQDIRHLNGII